MKQRLGNKKHKKCEDVANKKYTSCWTKGGWVHFDAQCWYSEYDADMVNWKNRTYRPLIRSGNFV